MEIRIRVLAFTRWLRGSRREVVHLSTAPLSFLFSSLKRRNERSSSKGCELWGQVPFLLVVAPRTVWTTTGSNRGLRQPGGGQLLTLFDRSTVIPSCPHCDPQLFPGLSRSPVDLDFSTGRVVGKVVRELLATRRSHVGRRGWRCAQLVDELGRSPGQPWGWRSLWTSPRRAVFLPGR